MRFVKVAVKNFQAIENAEVEFGQGLNIVFGPNDLGKSTLACAIRAALLVPPSSTEAHRYLPWFFDAVPEVTLTFTDDDGHFWKVRKCFGAHATADLHHSKDGVTFASDCRGREVEDQLRTILGWGIPSPGGKSAPRKLPTSFLAHVLLAEQTDIDAILGRSTEDDGTSTGRERLRKALAGLAEDPRFKKVLTETQTRVDELFTPKGQRKRGRGSPFASAADEVNKRAARVEALKKDVADSRAIEDHLRHLQAQCAEARDACDKSATTLANIRQQHARALERARSEEKLAQAKADLDALDQQASDFEGRARVVQGLEATVAAEEIRVVEMQAATERAEATAREAEEALRAATSEDGAHQREVTRAKLGEERAELGTRGGKAEKHVADIEVAHKALLAANWASQAKADAERDAERTRALEESAKHDLVEADEALELARGVLAYGHWHAADAAAKQGLEAKDRSDAFQAEAERKERAALEIGTQAAEAEAEAKARGERLPDVEFARRLEDLNQQIVLAEAALGGGFSLAFRGTGKVPVHVTIDDSDAVAGIAIDGGFVLEADRTASLRIGDLLDVEVVAGAAENRRALEALRERWTREALPALERAGLTTSAEVREQRAQVAELETKAASFRSDAKHLQMEAEAARQSASMHGQRAEELLAQGRQAPDFNATFSALDPETLATGFSKLGTPWKDQAERIVASKDRALALARARAENETQASVLAKYRLTEAEKTLATTDAEAMRLRASLVPTGGPEQGSPAEILDQAMARARSDLSDLASRRTAIEEQLHALEQQASSAASSAEAAVEEAKAEWDQCLEIQKQATKALDDARSAFHSTRGEVEAQRKALEHADRAGVEARLAAAQKEFDTYASDPPVSPEQIAAAEQRESETKATLDRLRTDLHQAEGALTKVGGVGAREELAREEDAFAIAKDQQRELEVDADAWKLLRETLEVVEKEGSSHLGRSLATPVSTRIVELTQGRYGGLRLDQHLKAEAVDLPLVNTDESVIGALSVGTRDQMATLLRLTVAEQLKSAIILDDHLVNTDPERLRWFRELLRNTALSTQVVVLTCRPHDYLAPSECPDVGATRDLAGGMTRAIDVAQLVRRFDAAPANSSLVGRKVGEVAVPYPAKA